MQFYFVEEDNQTILMGGNNKNLLTEAKAICLIQPNKTGFIGILDMTGRIRGTFMWSHYQDHHVKLSAFIRKYCAIESLETLSKMIRENIAKGIIK
jgi:hypothetical protein